MNIGMVDSPVDLISEILGCLIDEYGEGEQLVIPPHAPSEDKSKVIIAGSAEAGYTLTRFDR